MLRASLWARRRSKDGIDEVDDGGLVLHNGGNNRSEFPSWTTDESIAREVTSEGNGPGIVLRIPNADGPGHVRVPSPDIHGESEVLIRGPRIRSGGSAVVSPAPRVSVMTAIALVGAWDPTDTGVREAAVAALRRMPPAENLPLTPTDRETLIRINRRRLVRAADVLGTADLLHPLEEHKAPEVFGTALHDGALSIVLWLDANASMVVGCVVGTDATTSETTDNAAP